MNTRRILLALAAGLLGLSSAGSALASTELGRTRPDVYNGLFGWTAPSNTFYLQNGASSQVFKFKNARRLRICDEVKNGGVGLDVKHAGHMTQIKPGECEAVKGKRMALQPASHLPFGMSLVGKIETIKPAQQAG